MSSEGINNITSENEARLLDLTMRKREEIITQLTKSGIPEDKSDKALLVSMLDGIDRTILSKSKIKVDSKISDINAQAASLIANVLSSINAKSLKNIDENREIPQLTVIEGVHTFVDGELGTGIENNSYETFMAKFPTAD